MSAVRIRDGEGTLFRFTVQGKLERQWKLPVPCTGLDVDVSNNTFYLAGLGSPDLYSLAVNVPGAEVKGVFRIQGAARLGPVLIDKRTHRLYTSDILRGSMYEIDLITRRQRLFASFLGQPVALSLEETKGLIYVADAAGRSVLSVATNQQNPKAVRVLETGVASKLSALIRDPRGGFWVTDFDAGTVSYVSSAGQVGRRIKVP